MKANLLHLSVLFLFFSCNDLKKEYYDNGNLKREYYELENGYLDGTYKKYYKNGNLEVLSKYVKGHEKDTTIFFYDSKLPKIKAKRVHSDSVCAKQIEYSSEGYVKKEGYVCFDDLLKIGKWKFFKKSGRVDFIREYKLINDKPYLNQIWYLNKVGDTLYTPSKYFKVQLIQDTITIGEAILGAALMKSPFFKKEASAIRVFLPAGEENNFLPDFSNEREIKLDTFYNLIADKENQENFIGFSKPYTAAFGKWFKKTKGKYNLRGIIEESYIEDDTILKATKMYFEMPIYIKDTILPEPESQKVVLNY